MRWSGGRFTHNTARTQDGTPGREGCNSCSFFSHCAHIPAANATQRGLMAVASSVTIATTAALTTEVRRGVPFAEGAPTFIAANPQIGGGAALHTGED